MLKRFFHILWILCAAWAYMWGIEAPAFEGQWMLALAPAAVTGALSYVFFMAS